MDYRTIFLGKIDKYLGKIKRQAERVSTFDEANIYLTNLEKFVGYVSNAKEVRKNKGNEKAHRPRKPGLTRELYDNEIAGGATEDDLSTKYKTSRRQISSFRYWSRKKSQDSSLTSPEALPKTNN